VHRRLDPSTSSGRTDYLEPRKVKASRGYFAVAKVERIVPDPTARGMFLALIEPETYLDFVRPVPFSGAEGVIERGLLNEAGAISGRAQAAVRPL
jgi:putative restriction endonuclease